MHSAVEKQKKFVLTASHDYHSRFARQRKILEHETRFLTSLAKKIYHRHATSTYRGNARLNRIRTTRAYTYLFLFSSFSRVLFRTLTNLVALKEHTVYTRLFKGQQPCNKCLGSRYSCHVLACTPSSTSSTAKHSMLLFVLRPLAKAITI